MHVFKTFTELHENTRYHYRIGTCGETGRQKRDDGEGEDEDESDSGEQIEYWSPVYDFHTPPSDPHPFNFVMAADLVKYTL